MTSHAGHGGHVRASPDRVVAAAWALGCLAALAAAVVPTDLLPAKHVEAEGRAPEGDGQEPKVRDERLLLRTDAGDILIALFADVATRTVTRVIELAQAGAYDGARLGRTVPGVIVQLTDVRELGPERKSLLEGLPAEPSTRARHRRGVVTMARAPVGSPRFEPSFGILLGRVSQVDGRRTAIGFVEHGLDAAESVAALPRDARGRPRVHVKVREARVLTRAAAEGLPLRPAGIVGLRRDPRLGAAAGGIALASLAIAAALARNGRARSGRAAWSRLAGLIGIAHAVAAWTLLGPAVPTWLGAVVAVGAAVGIQLASPLEREAAS